MPLKIVSMKFDTCPFQFAVLSCFFLDMNVPILLRLIAQNVISTTHHTAMALKFQPPYQHAPRPVHVMGKFCVFLCFCWQFQCGSTFCNRYFFVFMSKVLKMNLVFRVNSMNVRRQKRHQIQNAHINLRSIAVVQRVKCVQKVKSTNCRVAGARVWSLSKEI